MKVLAAILSVGSIIGVTLATPKPEASLPALLKRQSQPGNLALKTNYKTVFTKISIGTPPQEVDLDIALGVGRLDVSPGWCDKYTDIPESTCFHNGTSSTYSSQGGGSDTVTIGGFTVENVPFSSGELSNELDAGVLNIEAPNGTVNSATPCPTGNRTLPCADISNSNPPPTSIWPSFRSQWPEPRVGIHIAKFPLEMVQLARSDIEPFPGLPNGTDAGTITVGGLNNNLYKGEVAYVDLVPDPPQQGTPPPGAIPLRSLTVNGQSLNVRTTTESTFAPDHISLTSNQELDFPPQFHDQVFDALAATTLNGYGQGLPCDTDFTISMGIQGRTFDIKVADLLVKNGTICYWPYNLGPGFVAGGVNSLITNPIKVGIGLLSSYVVFDYESNKIGFADLSDQATGGGSDGGSEGSGSDGTSTGGSSASPHSMGMSLSAVCGAFMGFVLAC